MAAPAAAADTVWRQQHQEALQQQLFQGAQKLCRKLVAAVHGSVSTTAASPAAVGVLHTLQRLHSAAFNPHAQLTQLHSSQEQCAQCMLLCKQNVRAPNRPAADAKLWK
jgi:hypothetical protein